MTIWVSFDRFITATHCDLVGSAFVTLEKSVYLQLFDSELLHLINESQTQNNVFSCLSPANELHGCKVHPDTADINFLAPRLAFPNSITLAQWCIT